MILCIFRDHFDNQHDNLTSLTNSKFYQNYQAYVTGSAAKSGHFFFFVWQTKTDQSGPIPKEMRDFAGHTKTDFLYCLVPFYLQERRGFEMNKFHAVRTVIGCAAFSVFMYAMLKD